ncbi:MAG: DUF11 domain-containing protein [Anaerolineae bacterium]|nr:DUF11 domain-containing protein [Anaerolineae bacterium]
MICATITRVGLAQTFFVSLSLSLFARTLLALVLLLSFPGAGPASAASVAAPRSPLVLPGIGQPSHLQSAPSTEATADAVAAQQPADESLDVSALDYIDPPLLSMIAAPAQIAAGEIVTYSVAISNVATTPLTGVVLSSTPPAGMVFVPNSAAGFVWSPRDGRLTWNAGDIQPGNGLAGGFQLRATGLTIGAVVTNTVTAASPALAQVVSSIAVIDVGPPASNSIWATPQEGGWLRAEDRRMDIRLPRQAVAQRTRINYARSADLPPLPDNILYAFRLEAVDENGTPVSRFNRPLTLSAFFDPRPLPPGAWQQLSLFHLNEGSGEWETVPGTVDLARRRVVASVDHFSEYGLGIDETETIPDFSVDRMTAVRGAQTSLYSRSIAYTYGFDLPAGRGGLSPVLGLSYNSANHSQHQGHYSYPGHGWAMPGVNYVQRSPTGNVTLVQDGQAYTLQSYNNGWFVQENPLIKVTYASGGDPYFGSPYWARWVVTMPDGVVYTYYGEVRLTGGQLDYASPMTFHWGCTPQGSGGEWRDLIWDQVPLTQIQDRHGNQIDYTWNFEKTIGANNMPYNCVPMMAPMNAHLRALRLTKISYNGGRNQVALSYAGRLDRPNGYNSGNTWHFYTDLRLTSVAVQAVFNGQSSLTTLRTYGLNHRDQGDPYAPLSQKMLSLTYIEEQAGNRSIRTNFDYSEHYGTWPCSFQYLNAVTNDFGGKVTFWADISSPQIPHNSPYECWDSDDNWKPPAVRQRTEQDKASGATATWSYDGSGWQTDAHGFAKVWVTLPGSAAQEIHEFEQMRDINGQQRDYLAGLEKKLTTCSSWNSSGNCTAELARVETQWELNSDNLPLPNYSALPQQDRPHFVWASEQRTYESRFNDNGTLAAAGVPVKKTTYEYQTGRQLGSVSGTKQFGNLTRVREYQGTSTGFESTPLRTRSAWFYPNESVWVIGKPATTKLYTGNEASLFAETRLYYDGSGSYTAAPNKGLVTKQETMSVLNGGYQSNPASTYSTFGYDASTGNLLWSKDANDRQTTTTYDSWYKAYPVCQQNALGQSVKTTFYGVPGDGACNTTNGTVSAVYDRFGQPEKQWDANNALSEYRYDDLGWLTSMAAAPDVIGAPTVRREYRPLSEIGANQPFWLHQQQRDGSAGDGTLHTWTFYDGFGRILQSKAEADNAGTTARHIETSSDYTWRDAVWHEGVPRFVNGSVVVAANAAPVYSAPNWAAASQQETVYGYDGRGRLLQTTLPDGSLVRQRYNVTFDGSNRTRLGQAVIDPMNHQTLGESDPFGRLWASKQFSGLYSGGPRWGDAAYAKALYYYNVQDQLTSVTDPANNSALISYDGLGRKSGMTDPDMGSWSYGYDLVGNLKSQTDARGQTICFYYDALNRLIGKHLLTAPSCPTWNNGNLSPLLARYYYDEQDPTLYGDSKGRRTQAVVYDANGNVSNIISWKYDQRGRITKDTRTIDGAPYATSYSYDSLDRTTWMQYPDGEGVTLAHSPQGQVKSLGSYLSDATFNARGQATCYRYGQVRQTRLNYRDSSDLRLGSIVSDVTSPGATSSCSEASGIATQNLAYTYDLTGNITSIVDSNNASQMQTFEYDALNRLTRGYTSSVGVGVYDENYPYDATGNLTSKGGVGSYTYGVQAADCPEGALSKPHAVVAAGSSYLFYCYDQNGNMRRRKVGTTATTFTYDAENRLVNVGGADTFVYDADGGRVKTTFDGTTTIYVGSHYEKTGNAITK